MKGQISIAFRGRVLDVTFEYNESPTIHSYSNGDPGHPGSEEYEILFLVDNATRKDLISLFDRYEAITKEGIWVELDEVILTSDEFIEWKSINFYESILDEECDDPRNDGTILRFSGTATDLCNGDGSWVPSYFDSTTVPIRLTGSVNTKSVTFTTLNDTISGTN